MRTDTTTQGSPGETAANFFNVGGNSKGDKLNEFLAPTFDWFDTTVRPDALEYRTRLRQRLAEQRTKALRYYPINGDFLRGVPPNLFCEFAQRAFGLVGVRGLWFAVDVDTNGGDPVTALVNLHEFDGRYRITSVRGAEGLLDAVEWLKREAQSNEASPPKPCIMHPSTLPAPVGTPPKLQKTDKG